MKKLAIILFAILAFSTMASAQLTCSGGITITDPSYIPGDYYTIEGRIEPQGGTPTGLYQDPANPYTNGATSYSYSFTVSEFVYIPNPLTQTYFNIRLRVWKHSGMLAPTYRVTSSTIAKYDFQGHLTAESDLEVKF